MKLRNILLTAFGLLLLASCGNKEKRENDSTLFEFSDYKYDYIIKVDSINSDTFSNGDGTMHIHGALVLPLKINDNDISALRDSLLNLVEVKLENNQKIVPLPQEGVTITDINPAEADPSMESINTLIISLINSRMIVWSDYFYAYTGGAHGMSENCFINYNIPSNKILSVNDLFKPGFENSLNELIRQHIEYEYEDKIYADEDIDSIEYTDNFHITPSGVEFVYNPYLIGPWSSGTISIEISLNELEDADILNPETKSAIFGL